MKVIILIISCLLLSSAHRSPTINKFPFEKEGLTDRAAAAHLLSRFTFGLTKSDISHVTNQGIEQWFSRQLASSNDESFLEAKLSQISIAHLSTAQIKERYPSLKELERRAIADGYIDETRVKGASIARRQKIKAYAREKGVKGDKDLLNEIKELKIVRAAYSANQVQEVMTEFWSNHFYISATKRQCIPYLLSFERDVIQKHALGTFPELLLATAKSPAMLLYLDNAGSIVKNVKGKSNQSKRGLNENYARELLELHTLGVDGGYTQTDVTETARILTGWGLASDESQKKKNVPDHSHDFKEGDFHFRMNNHDVGQKKVLGREFAAGRGFSEGIELLEMLALHPNTAKFICRKIAIRFVSDSPPQALIDEMSSEFLKTKGDIKSVLNKMVSSSLFWNSAAVRQKIKSPFELAVSAIRSLNADVTNAKSLRVWLDRMGQKLYQYPAPTGYPDRASYWISTGSLLNRMNFALALASGEVRGIKVDLLALNDNHEPASSQEALRSYLHILLPERDHVSTIERVLPLISQPNVSKKIATEAKKHDTPEAEKSDEGLIQVDDEALSNDIDDVTSYQLSEVVGIILGSPEFQRR